MMEVRISEDDWCAELICSPQSHMAGFMHCTAKVVGRTEAHALDGAKAVLDLFAKGREAFVRVAPEASTERDFDTKEVRYRGYVRFSVKLEAGEWHSPSELNHVYPEGLLADHNNLLRRAGNASAANKKYGA